MARKLVLPPPIHSVKVGPRQPFYSIVDNFLAVQEVYDIMECVKARKDAFTNWRDYANKDVDEYLLGSRPERLRRLLDGLLLKQDNLWGLEVNSLAAMSILRYRKNQKLRLHVDYKHYQGWYKKLVCITMLTHPNAYEGGGLQISEDIDPIKPLPGQAIIFPAYTMHGVHPVTSGERYVLSCFAVGPPLV